MGISVHFYLLIKMYAPILYAYVHDLCYKMIASRLGAYVFCAWLSAAHFFYFQFHSFGGKTQ